MRGPCETHGGGKREQGAEAPRFVVLRRMSISPRVLPLVQWWASQPRSEVTVQSSSRLELLHLVIPLVRPFTNASGSVSKRTIGLTKLTRGDVVGWGESSPYPGQDIDLDAAIAETRRGHKPATLMAGIDQASNDVAARIGHRRLAHTVGVTRASVPISVAVGVGSGARAAVAEAVTLGVRRFKVKVGPGEISHVSEIRRHHPDVILGIDANGSFDSESVEELAHLSDHNIAYVEEPAPAADEGVYQQVRRYIDAPMFADESVRSLVDIQAMAEGGSVDGVVIKPGRLGFSGALEAVALAEKCGLRWRASGLLETSVGRAYTNLLASLPNAFVSDVAPADWFLERDLATTVIDNGAIVLPEGDGSGVEPNEAVIDRYLIGRHDLSHLLEVD